MHEEEESIDEIILEIKRINASIPLLTRIIAYLYSHRAPKYNLWLELADELEDEAPWIQVERRKDSKLREKVNSYLYKIRHNLMPRTQPIKIITQPSRRIS